VAALEVELAQRLVVADAPVAALEARVEPRVYKRLGFAVTLWIYYDTSSSDQLSPADYSHALQRVHAAMRNIDVATPHVTDRIEQARRLVANRYRTPALDAAGRKLLQDTLNSVRQYIARRGAAEQLLHGEPHPGNVLNTTQGPLFIDLETCCRGPVEFDVAHVPGDVSEHYPGIDRDLLNECRRGGACDGRRVAMGRSRPVSRRTSSRPRDPGLSPAWSTLAITRRTRQHVMTTMRPSSRSTPQPLRLDHQDARRPDLPRARIHGHGIRPKRRVALVRRQPEIGRGERLGVVRRARGCGASRRPRRSSLPPRRMQRARCRGTRVPHTRQGEATWRANPVSPLRCRAARAP
jgi:Phosphotransferase enzyme family